MRVRCITNKKPNKHTVFEALKINREYVVLAIECYDLGCSSFAKLGGDFVLYRLKDEVGNIKPYPAKVFEITSACLPSCWTVYKSDEQSLEILPRLWAKKYFWDDYYNDVPQAVEDFEIAEKEMLQEELV